MPDDPPEFDRSTSDRPFTASSRESELRPDADESTSVPLDPTAQAPSMPPDVSPKAAGARADLACLPALGERIGDFRLIAELGRGAMGVVFLARQISLDRQVALKISPNIGDEARTMAALEHRHIVQVFSESVQADRDLRLLCMQYVPGTTLQDVVCQVAGSAGNCLDGGSMLQIVDRSSIAPALLDPDALRDRQRLMQSGTVETVCWIGARLAEALAYAHHQRVLHRDIKPANILIDQYGHPCLADFSLSSRELPDRDASDALFGGTLGYMAPEHLDAFNPDMAAPKEIVDERSDIYSLGVVLYEMFTLRLPHGSREYEGPRTLEALASERRNRAIEMRTIRPPLPESLQKTLRKCLAPHPAARFQTAEELAAALDGSAELHRAVEQLPSFGPIARVASRHPYVSTMLLAVVPHLIGSAVNITYNAWQIVDQLTRHQQTTFAQLVLVYNAIVYPFCLWCLVRLMRPVFRAHRAMRANEPIDDAELAAARRRALKWPVWCVLVASVGWFPGALLFPLGLHWFADLNSWNIFRHFVVSFALSGLIALTYSFFGLQFIALRVFYPRLWNPDRKLRETAQVELSSLNRSLKTMQLLAGLIPLAGAALLVGVGPQELTGEDYRQYQMLVLVLIALGLAGFQLALFASAQLTKTASAMTGSVGRTPPS